MSIFVIGRNEWSEKLHHHFGFSGVIDDYYAAPTWQGIKVMRLSDVPDGAIVVNAVTSISPLSVVARLASRKDLQIKQAADVIRGLGDALQPDFVLDMRAALKAGQPAFDWVRSLLADDASRHAWDALIAFRSSADISHMHGFSVRLDEQYFESFAELPAQGVFVDCGGFDGDTSETLAKRYPWHGRIHLFEPDAVNLGKARDRLSGLPDVIFHPQGVSDADGELYFDAGAGSASSVSQSGSTRIEVTTLDAAVNDIVHFIKMDLEGWELPALNGARRHVLISHPILAIAVYHQADHFWQIPATILAMRSDYKVYLRHYTEGWSESVMYFVPADRESCSRNAIPSLA